MRERRPWLLIGKQREVAHGAMRRLAAAVDQPAMRSYYLPVEEGRALIHLALWKSLCAYYEEPTSLWAL